LATIVTPRQLRLAARLASWPSRGTRSDRRRPVRKLGRERINRESAPSAEIAGGSWPWQSARVSGRTISNLAGLHGSQALGHACAMDSLPPPLAFLVLLFAGWVNRQQQPVIEESAQALEVARRRRC
jgi:hypothetical protein